MNLYTDKNEFYMILVSTDFDEKHNRNTLSKFVNYLPRTINVSGGNWCMALDSIYIHNEFKKPDKNEAAYIKVYCEQIRPFGLESQCIAVFAKPDENESKKRLYYEPKVKQYFPLNCNLIDDLSISLLAGTKNKTKSDTEILSGQPTIVTVHFKKRDLNMAYAYVKVESNDETSKNLFPDNTANKFRCTLGNEYKFDPANMDWAIAVKAITYMPDMKSAIKSPFMIQLFNSDKSAHFDKEIEYEFNETEGEEYKYVNYLNEIFAKALATAGGKPLIIIDSAVESMGKKRFITSSMSLYVNLPLALFYNMGIRNFNTIDKGGHFIYLKDGNDKSVLCLQLNENVPFYCDVPIDPIAYNPEMGLIYCDFVKPSMLGRGEFPILKAFPLLRSASNKSSYHTHEVNNLQYYPISKYDLSTVEFSLRDISGNLLPFRQETANVIISLAIRPQ